MHIVIAAPISLDMIMGVQFRQRPIGYPFPMTADLCNCYIQAGHQVTVVTSSPDLKDLVEIDSPCARIIVVPYRPRARARALDLFRAERLWLRSAIELAQGVDAIHAHWSYEFAWAALGTGLPTLVTVHDWAPAILRQERDIYRLVRAIMQRYVLKRANFVTAPSRYIATKVREAYNLKVEVVPNGLMNLEARAIRADLRNHANDSEVTVGMLNASNDRRKNVDKGVQAFLRAAERRKGLSLRIAGPPFDNPAELKWKTRKMLNASSANVRFDGRLTAEAVNRWMEEIDIFLHPSMEESFGMVLIEAMSAGAIVIGGKYAGAVPEIVGNSGLLVDTRRSERMEEAILEASMATEPATGMRRRSLARASEYDMGQVGAKYLKLLHQIAIR